MDLNLGRVTVQSHCGATLKLLTLNLLCLKTLDIFNNEAKPPGLEVSRPRLWGLQEFVQSVCVCGEDTEDTENFTYLDSVVHDSRLPDQEVIRRAEFLPDGSL